MSSWRRISKEKWREYRKKYVENHKEAVRDYNRNYLRNLHIIQRQEYLKWKDFAGPCIKCGMSDARVLEFHHHNPVEKKFRITENQWFHSPLELLIGEIAKCEVLCSNCHRIEELENGVWSRSSEVQQIMSKMRKIMPR